MSRIALWTAGATLALGGVVLAHRIVSRDATRSDCPGRIVCPITGKEVCIDRCPLTKQEAKAQAVPACCRKAE
jgi:hypothetical protein